MTTLSIDLRERIVKAYDRGEGTRQQIADRYNVSLGMVKKLLQQRRRTGDIANRHHFSGRKPKITAKHQQQLKLLIQQQPDATLKELREAVGLQCTLPAIHYVLLRLGLPLKKTLRPAELNRPDIQEARKQWAIAVDSVLHRRFLFIDESGAKTNMTRLYGRAPRGDRVYDYVPCGRWTTTTMIAAVGRNGPQACWVLDGPMDGDAFAVWATFILAPTLEPDDIVIMDNLSVHKNKDARAAIENTGAEIWDLPAYSPDLNPIEKMWSKIKSNLRKVKARDNEALLRAIGKAMEQVSHLDIVNWFASCGYSLI